MLAVQLLRGEKGTVARAVQWAERIADELQRAGYGWTREQASRESVDWLARLSAEQRAGFDAFWSAFRPRSGQTGGKQRAAKAWAEIDPSAELVRARIVPAAEADGRRHRSEGDKRAWAERWLRERRWEDVDTGPATTDATALRVRQVRQELASLAAARMRGIMGTERQEQALRAELERLEGGADGGKHA